MPKVLIVSKHFPQHQIGAQKSGQNSVLTEFLEFFRKKSYAVTLLLTETKVDFLHIPINSCSFKIISREIIRKNDAYHISSFKARVMARAWQAYIRQPTFIQHVFEYWRNRIRSSRGCAHLIGHFPSSETINFVRNALRSEKPDIVLYDTIFSYCGQITEAEQWVLTQDIQHQRVASFASLGIPVQPSDLTAKTEGEIIENIGNAIAIQWDDARALQRIAPQSRIVVVPASAQPPLTVSSSARVPGRCIFIASGSLHNLDGIRWFLQNCWSHIRQAVPSAHLYIYGTVGLRLKNLPDGVQTKGVVESLDAIYADASIALVPLRVGSGLKVKIVEAFAHGAPIVTTSIGAQGLFHLKPRPFLLADTADDFAQNVVSLLRSSELQEQFSARARSCSNIFHPDHVFAAFDQALHQLPAHVPAD